MWQKDFKKTNAQARVQYLLHLLQQAILCRNLNLQQRVLRKLKAIKNDLTLIQVRSMHIKSSSFNINGLSNEDSLATFDSLKKK